MAHSGGGTSGELGTTAKIAMVFVLLGAGLGALGLRLGGPFVGGAVASFGVAAILGGVHSMVTRRHRTAGGFQRSYLVKLHSGVAAVLFGVTFLVPGLLMVGAGLAMALGRGDALWDGLAARPGEAVMVFGIWAAVGGLGLLISRWGWADVSTSWWERLPGRVLGLFLLLAGSGVTVAGWSLSSDPEGPGAAFGRMVEWVAGMLAGA